MTLACKQQTSCLLRFHLLICTRGLSASKGDCTVHFLKIGTSSSEDGDGSENITEKVNLHFLQSSLRLLQVTNFVKCR